MVSRVGTRLPSARLPAPSVKTFEPAIAVRLMKAFALARFDEAVEVSLDLNVDPKRSNQVVRGVAALPHSIGKQAVVAVFARGDKAQEALAAGADFVGAEDLIEMVQRKEVPFTKTIATPDLMPLVARVGKILGPRGLMPNPKVGSLTFEIKEAVQRAKQGEISFRTDRDGNCYGVIGKVSMSSDSIIDNFK